MLLPEQRSKGTVKYSCSMQGNSRNSLDLSLNQHLLTPPKGWPHPSQDPVLFGKVLQLCGRWTTMIGNKWTKRQPLPIEVGRTESQDEDSQSKARLTGTAHSSHTKLLWPVISQACLFIQSSRCAGRRSGWSLLHPQNYWARGLEQHENL